MRPTRLELQGFASFREHTVIDFTDADLFVLSGPTGAGKSTVVDAMSFALYGSVARYDDSRLVEPVISQGLRDARVLLDFHADGVGYRVARRVQRQTGGGATTKEARLERLPDVDGGDPIDLAIGAREVSAEVEALLGLSFEHFCRTVVLPQGAFQEFLHAKPGERQELLVRLLDLGIYRDVAKRARARASEANAQVEALLPQLEKLAGVTPDAIATVRDRVGALQTLADQVAQAQPELDRIKDEGAEARARCNAAKAALERVRAVEAPDGMDELASRIAAADAAATDAAEALELAAGAREQAEDALESVAGSDRLQHLQQLLAAVPTAIEAREAAKSEAATQAEHAAAVKQQRQDADDALVQARAALAEAERTHRVHALREHLVAGEPCPLCEQDVVAVPDQVVPGDLEEARAAVTGAQEAARRAADLAGKADVTAARSAEQVAAAERRVAEARSAATAMADQLGFDQDVTVEVVEEALAKARRGEQALATARQAERRAREVVTAAREARTALDGDRTRAVARLREAHGRVADLGAPAPGDDLAASWKALVTWAEEATGNHTDAVAQAEQAVGVLVERWQQRHAEVTASCTRAGVDVPKGTSPEAAVAMARAEASGQLERLEQQVADATALQEKVERLRSDSEVARVLGQLLNAKNFEQWLLGRGLTRLVLGASTILDDLSRGAYGLTLADDNTFLVVDHRNADEPRHARSLSGGETFLASLALALSLAEHVADLAARGSAKLEALFLDEGFGTLDADTLDVVATSIEELGATGRMVGVITHVQELATRVPTRFEVRKGPGGSTVERIDT